MDLIRSLSIAFSMYSRVPVPRVRWDEHSARYVLFFFPLVGAVEGVLLLGLWRLLTALGCPVLLRAALLVCFPYLYTGGIHLDGFLDTVDALGSWRTREERLHILKDVHTGSFAVLACVLLCLLQLSAWSALDSGRAVGVVAVCLPFSRSITVLSLLFLPNARGEGSAHRFSSGAARQLTAVGAGITAVFSAAAAFWLIGAGIAGCVFLLRIFLSIAYALLRACSAFGGLTGDLAGFLLTVTELSALIVTALFSLE